MILQKNSLINVNYEFNCKLFVWVAVLHFACNDVVQLMPSLHHCRCHSIANCLLVGILTCEELKN